MEEDPALAAAEVVGGVAAEDAVGDVAVVAGALHEPDQETRMTAAHAPDKVVMSRELSMLGTLEDVERPWVLDS